MSSLIPIIIHFLPKLSGAIGLLTKFPEAVQTVKDLKEFVEKIMAVLNRPGMLTGEQRKALDDFIESRKDAPYWQSEEDVTP